VAAVRLPAASQSYVVEAQITHEWKDVEFRSKVVSVLKYARVRVLGYHLVRRV
jgi:hypothetical protein